MCMAMPRSNSTRSEWNALDLPHDILIDNLKRSEVKQVEFDPHELRSGAKEDTASCDYSEKRQASAITKHTPASYSRKHLNLSLSCATLLILLALHLFHFL